MPRTTPATRSASSSLIELLERIVMAGVAVTAESLADTAPELTADSDQAVSDS